MSYFQIAKEFERDLTVLAMIPDKKRKKITDVNPIDEIQLGAYSHCRLLLPLPFAPLLYLYFLSSYWSFAELLFFHPIFFLSFLLARSFPGHSSSVKRNDASATRLDSDFISASPNYRAVEENLSYIVAYN